jgi:hypothetical protein
MMTYKNHKERATFSVCDLGGVPIIIGHSWLRKHNPEIDWETGTIEMTRCPRECGHEFSQKPKEKI